MPPHPLTPPSDDRPRALASADAAAWFAEDESGALIDGWVLERRSRVDLLAAEYELRGPGGELARGFRLHQRWNEDEQLAATFIWAARRANVLAHPGFCATLREGLQLRRALVTIERSPGEVLSELIERRRGRMAPLEVLRIGADLAEALSAAHDHGVVHGSVRPDRVRLRDDGSVQLFGIGWAPLELEVAARSELAAFPGAAAFTAPEVLGGEGPSAQSDVFGLGALLFALLTGDPPCLGENDAHHRTELLHGRLTPLQDLAPSAPALLAELIDGCVRFSPRARPASMAELAHSIRSCAELQELRLLRSLRPITSLPPSRSRPRAPMMVAATLAALPTPPSLRSRVASEETAMSMPPMPVRASALLVKETPPPPSLRHPPLLDVSGAGRGRPLGELLATALLTATASTDGANLGALVRELEQRAGAARRLTLTVTEQGFALDGSPVMVATGPLHVLPRRWLRDGVVALELRAPIDSTVLARVLRLLAKPPAPGPAATEDLATALWALQAPCFRATTLSGFALAAATDATELAADRDRLLGTLRWEAERARASFERSRRRRAPIGRDGRRTDPLGTTPPSQRDHAPGSQGRASAAVPGARLLVDAPILDALRRALESEREPAGVRIGTALGAAVSATDGEVRERLLGAGQRAFEHLAKRRPVEATTMLESAALTLEGAGATDAARSFVARCVGLETLTALVSSSYVSDLSGSLAALLGRAESEQARELVPLLCAHDAPELGVLLDAALSAALPAEEAALAALVELGDVGLALPLLAAAIRLRTNADEDRRASLDVLVERASGSEQQLVAAVAIAELEGAGSMIGGRALAAQLGDGDERARVATLERLARHRVHTAGPQLLARVRGPAFDTLEPAEKASLFDGLARLMPTHAESVALTILQDERSDHEHDGSRELAAAFLGRKGSSPYVLSVLEVHETDRSPRVAAAATRAVRLLRDRRFPTPESKREHR